MSIVIQVENLSKYDRLGIIAMSDSEGAICQP